MTLTIEILNFEFIIRIFSRSFLFPKSFTFIDIRFSKGSLDSDGSYSGKHLDVIKYGQFKAKDFTHKSFTIMNKKYNWRTK